MSFRVHLCSEISPLLILYLIVLGKQRHSLYRECQRSLEPFGIEPLHESLLEPRQAVPVRFFTVREAEFSENALEIILVIVRYVPEHCLEVSCSGRLVDRIDYLLETVSDHLVYRSLLQ